MEDNRRNQLLQLVEKEFIGPDPIEWEGLLQENGEEILTADPPRTRYIAGILFPQETTEEDADIDEGELPNIENEEDDDSPVTEIESSGNVSASEEEYLEDAEELINRSNAYRQSAMSFTVAISEGDTINASVSAGTYKTIKAMNPQTGKESVRYPRTALLWNNRDNPIVLPTQQDGIKTFKVDETGLQLDVTYRYKKGTYSIYTFTIENTKHNQGGAVRDEDCFFQAKLKIFSQKGFCALPNSQRINTDDEDYWSNQLLYRDVHNYAIGHGCAVDWEESEDCVCWISSATFPSYEIKPIVPAAIPGVSLEMLNMSPYGNVEDTIKELKTLCEKYGEWIEGLSQRIDSLDLQYIETAKRHVSNCKICLERMSAGVELLEKNEKVRTAFQYMNLAMLMQQLHYNLPLQKWKSDGNGDITLINAIKKMPDVLDPDTWYGDRVYGKWRPFQLAFVLMNLNAIYDPYCDERKIVDLIWFPTGGGKTEAYLGLSAYTIFIRKMLNRDDYGTTILMRYTLRLLTAQQYERASSMICACEIIRRNHEDLFGNNRISIGLWVGDSTTPNKMSKAVEAYNKMKTNGGSNPFVMLKCPWCGAEMGIVEREPGLYETPGYKKVRGAHRKEKIIFQCRNHENGCEFSETGYELPLYVIDEAIYEQTPTLLLGTVDKFAMLPFKPQAQCLFGIRNGEKMSSPDLIIQDELHLISGPLGSMVGHYETLINELCKVSTPDGDVYPKIVASTATISRAKEQCHALYGCPRNNVFQFPPSGLEYSDSFFAEEKKDANGRQYVGILASGSSSDTTTAIRLYASLLYAAKALEVECEEERDPYWTNIGYFNSIRELGQAATWIRADIDQHLDVIYKRRFENKKYDTKEEYRNNRRYIYRDEELTSRISGSKVTASLSNLNIKYPYEKDADGKIIDPPIDICLATNMISVGLDVPRLGLMTVAGQPKTTSEYIQATSRVGRDAAKAPGIVFVLYRPGRPRDKSYYEHFKEYHSKIYCNVEPTSVTPFSAPIRERALHALLIGMMRQENDENFNSDPPCLPSDELYDYVCDVVERRVTSVDSGETEDTLKKMEHIIQQWEDWNPQKWEPAYNMDMSYGEEVPLMYPAGSYANLAWGERGMKTPTSMRNVDASCEAEVLANRYFAKED